MHCHDLQIRKAGTNKCMTVPAAPGGDQQATLNGAFLALHDCRIDDGGQIFGFEPYVNASGLVESGRFRIRSRLSDMCLTLLTAESRTTGVDGGAYLTTYSCTHWGPFAQRFVLAPLPHPAGECRWRWLKG